MKKINSFLKNDLKAAIFDADGVFYDGHEYASVIKGQMVIMKRRHFHDSQGIAFLRTIGLRILFVSGEKEPLNYHVKKFNSLKSVKDKRWPKIDMFVNKSGKEKTVVVSRWLKKNNLDWSHCIYMGDDMYDYDVMRTLKMKGGVPVCPANSTRIIKKLSTLITKKEGGKGAIRELAEIIVDARGKSETDMLLK